MNRSDKIREKGIKSKYKVGECISLSACLGMLVGVLFDNTLNGFIIGMLFGSAIGAVFQRNPEKQEPEKDKTGGHEN